MEPLEVINEITTSILDLPKNPFCTIPQTEEDHKTLIGLSCKYAEKMEDTGYKAFQPIVQEYDFNELYSAIDNFIGYQHWVFSQFSEGQLGDIIKELCGDQNIREAELNQDTRELFVDNVERYGEVKFFKELEFNFFSLRAISCKSVETWVHRTLFCIVTEVVGHLSTRRLCKELGKVPSYDKTVFNYGEYKPFEGYLEKYGLDGVRTTKVDGEIEKILEKDSEKIFKHPYNLNEELEKSFKITGTQRHKEHDMVNTYAEKWLERIKELDGFEALEMLYKGVLRVFTKNRAQDRVTNVLTDKRLQKHGGRSLKELGEDIKERRKKINLTQAGLATSTGLAVTILGLIEKGKYSRLSETKIVKIASALEVDVNTLLGGAIIIQTDFQEDIDEDKDKTVRVTYSGNFPESKQRPTGEESEEYDLSYKENKIEQDYLSKFSSTSDHYRVLKIIFDSDFTTSRRERGEKRLFNKAEIARKAGISLKRIRKIIADFKNDPEFKELLK